MFSPIEGLAQLPNVDAGYEKTSLDFKVKALGTDRFEAAKDVAALANTYGGTIIVGAAAAGEFVKKYLPLTLEDASGTQRHYEEAVRDLCRPTPLFNVVPIEVDSGKVVAINVWPFAGQPIGVRLKKDDLVRQLEDVFVYPIRSGAHTKAILPEQLHMFVDAKFRRTVIALHGSQGSRIKILGRTKNGGWWGIGEVLAVDELGNALELLLDFPEGKKGRFALPLDVIEAVWRDRGAWKIRIPGEIRPLSWLPNVGNEYQEEEATFLELRAAAVREKDREREVRVTQFPHPPSLLATAANFLRRRLRTPPW